MDWLPKNPLAGSLHLEWKRCGRPKCQCGHGLLHGPYVYWHRREAGRQVKAYVPMAMLGDVIARMDEVAANGFRPKDARQLHKELGHDD